MTVKCSSEKGTHSKDGSGQVGGRAWALGSHSPVPVLLHHHHGAPAPRLPPKLPVVFNIHSHLPKELMWSQPCLYLLGVDVAYLAVGDTKNGLKMLFPLPRLLFLIYTLSLGNSIQAYAFLNTSHSHVSVSSSNFLLGSRHKFPTLSCSSSLLRHVLNLPLCHQTSSSSWIPSLGWEHSHWPRCYGLNLHAPTKFICWNLNPECGGTRRWGLWKVITPWRWSPYKWD